jgi:CRP-like cAMP-binding protein
MTEDGKELMTCVYYPDEYFGITSLFTGREYKETAEVLEDATLCSIPREVMDQLVFKYPDVAENSLKFWRRMLSTMNSSFYILLIFQ